MRRAHRAELPVLGADAFRTATGVHAAAVVKAFRMGDRALMDAVYAAVPASLVGRQQEIEVGPMSGRSNVIFWLESRGLTATDEIVDRISPRPRRRTGCDPREGPEPDRRRRKIKPSGTSRSRNAVMDSKRHEFIS